MKGLQSVEECWEKNWKAIILNDDGSVNLEQLKKELHDFTLIIGCATEAFSLVTGGRPSKPNSDPEWVEHFAEDHYREMFARE